MLQLAKSVHVPVTHYGSYTAMITPAISTALDAFGCQGCEVLVEDLDGPLHTSACYYCPVHNRHMVIVSIRDEERGISVAFLLGDGAVGPDPTQ